MIRAFAVAALAVCAALVTALSASGSAARPYVVVLSVTPVVAKND